jgi:hypothetical protein
MKAKKAETAAQTARNKLLCSTKTVHFIRQTSYKMHVQIPKAICSLILSVHVFHCKKPHINNTQFG